MVSHEPLQLPVSGLAPVPYYQQLPSPKPVLLLRRARQCADRVLRQQLSPYPVDLPSPLTPHCPRHSPSLRVVDIPAHHHPCGIIRFHHPILAVVFPLPAPVVSLITGCVVTHRHSVHRRQPSGRRIYRVSLIVHSSNSVGLVDCAVAPGVIKERLPENSLVYVVARRSLRV